VFTVLFSSSSHEFEFWRSGILSRPETLKCRRDRQIGKLNGITPNQTLLFWKNRVRLILSITAYPSNSPNCRSV